MKLTRFSLTLLSILPFILHADQIGFPDDLLSNGGQTKFEMGINYNNLTSEGFTERSNTDSIAWTPGVRYGITSRTELYTRASWYNESTHTKSNFSTTETSTSASRLNDLWIGINHRIWDDATTPGLYLFLEGAAMENATAGSNVNPTYGKTWQFGGTMYRSSDPVILATTATYRHSLKKDYGNNFSSDASYAFILNPTVSFAANNEISLTSGFQWQRQGELVASSSSGLIKTPPTTRTDLILGVGYMWSDNLTLHLSTSTDMTGAGGSSISMMGIYSLGDRKRKNDDSQMSDELRAKPTIAPKEPEGKDPISSSYVAPTSTIPTPKGELEAQTPPPQTEIPSGQFTMAMTSNAKKTLLSCTQVANGWNESQLECHEIDQTISTAPLGTFQSELAEGKNWITHQNPSHYTVEISIQNRKEQSLLMDHLRKTRFSYSHPSHLHSLPDHMAAIALGSFQARQEALDFLYSLPFVTHKSNSLLRTFDGLSR
jgi:hypothetical protein